MPLVSAVIPVYNGEPFIADALTSIREQRYEPIEILVIDDGSTDGTRAVVDRFPEARRVHQPNRGVPSARNAGVREARGDLVAFLDCDDLWSADKLHLQVSRLAADPTRDIALGQTQLMRMVTGSGGREFEPWGSPVMALSMGGAVVRRAVFDRVGPFDETQRYCDDLDWFMRARHLGVAIDVHGEVVQYYRRHANNMTNERDLGKRYLLAMLKKSVDRRRGRAGPAPGTP